MPNLFTVPAGHAIAAHAARHMLATLPDAALARAVVLVPTQRACVTMRAAFAQALGGTTALLPRILPLADIGQELVALLGPRAFELLASIPPAMPPEQHRYMLAKQIMVFERSRLGAVTLDYALTLADALVALHDQCARAGVQLTHEALRPLVHADFATHWEQSLQFLGILTEHWPGLEAELGLTTAATREVAVLTALTEAWQHNPPDYPVIVVGSTASQPSTAALLQVIADMPTGSVILPGLDAAMPAQEWALIEAGHPLYHLKHFLDRWPLPPNAVTPLTTGPRSVWMDALAATAQIPAWKNTALTDHHQLRLIACAHAEEEVRVIALLLREALENPDFNVALVTPDEGLMARVASHMKRYDVTLDRLNAGTLATTQTGSLWAALAAAIAEPERMALLRSLLHHTLLDIAGELLRGLEPGWHGVQRGHRGQLPPLSEAVRAHADFPPIESLVRELARLSRAQLTATQWVDAGKALLARFVQASGQGHEAVETQLDALVHADAFGPLEIREFVALLQQQLAAPWRDAGLRSHPQVFMLTPVEARLQQFDRVILANMQEALWPGAHTPSPWLNLASQKALGLPSPQERISLMAHDMLMLGSSGEVFLTYPKRDQGSPTARSRFIERLVTLLATHGISAQAITDTRIIGWANTLQAAGDYTPEPAPRPLPARAERPQRLPVSALDALFSDPFSIYAKHVLNLRKLNEIDADPEASDFGNLAHKAIQALSEHWNAHARAATAEEIAAITDHALRDFSDRPNIALFWRARLVGALDFVNGLEGERRQQPLRVASEIPVEATLTLADEKTLTLHGRMDRVEQGTAGSALIDYKTGQAPTEKDMLNGKNVQLLAYAMMVAEQGGQPGALEYWKLPHGNAVGEIHSTTMDALIENHLPTQLRAALSQMLDETTPFLARPVPNSRDERFGNDYDGISRYDEWAG
ncbi:MAG: PD-(D/E)XK nuclease family protein [Pseudomonadota bacterium]